MGADQSTAIHDITGTSFPLSKCRIVVVGPTRSSKIVKFSIICPLSSLH